MLTPRVVSVLEDLEKWGEENDRVQTERSRKMLNLDRGTAELMRALIASRQPRRILEIGTSNGYSTIWLAASLAASSQNAERVFTIDRNAEKHRLARENLERAGLAASVEFLTGDATELVAKIDGPLDVVFFDGDRFTAPAQLASLVPKLAPSALILADNALSHPNEIAGYLAAIAVLPDFERTVVPVGKGLSVAFRVA
jgi:predicted O-methyltransferase YrrM